MLAIYIPTNIAFLYVRLDGLQFQMESIDDDDDREVEEGWGAHRSVRTYCLREDLFTLDLYDRKSEALGDAEEYRKY